MRSLAVVVLAGCFHPSIPAGAPCADDGSCPGELTCRAGRCEPGEPIDARMTDAPADTTNDAAPADAFVCTTFSGQFDTCTLAAGSPLNIVGAGWTYDTDLQELRNAGTLVPVTRALVAGKAVPIEVLVVDTFTVSPGSVLRVTGSVPFGVVARGAVTISGTIDASNGGAGARGAAACGTAAGARPAAHGQGPGGGGGGAFRGAGGTGGEGDANGTGEDGGVGGIAVALPLGPLGGCPGGTGANGDAAGTAGLQGQAGGAIYLVGAGALSVAASGTVQVGGGGGGHGESPAGSGGGGGAGGMILIEAAAVNVTGTLVANGGGGGGGADNDPVEGSDGGNGTTSTTRAAGGAGAANGEGGDGGGGGAGALLGGTTSTSTPDNGGGGGGGGVGYISIIGIANTSGAVISPALTPFP
jgi:hypothetical protein